MLLAASHLVRLIHPFDSVPSNDEQVIMLHAVKGDRELADPVRLSFRQFTPDSFDRATPTIVLVHGSPGDNGEVTALAKILGKKFRTIAPDMPGFGGSSWDVPDYSNRAHAHYLLQLLDSLGVRQTHLLGFSMGGGVVLQAEDIRPSRVRSIVMLSAIGAQEYELIGDYHLNHLIHGLQLGGLWLLREGTPHFGWLDDAMLSVAYARNFYDTDQRPLRGILTKYPGPMLILQGEQDPLVSAALAREHARIVPQAELDMNDGDHFQAFMYPDRIAAPVTAFVEKVERGEAVTRATTTPERLAAAAEPFDPRNLPKVTGMALVILCLLIALGTLLSEDLTCITTGLMIARGTISFFTGTLACFIGIFVGDLLVFLAGRSLGRAVLGKAPLRWFLTPEAVQWSSTWIQRRGAVLVFATRVLPGTRLPTYFAAGMLRTSLSRFAAYFFVACAIWTPILVGISVGFGEATQRALTVFRDRAALYLLVSAVVLFVLLKFLIPLLSWRGRRLLLSRWRRLTRWEFWPRWAFYPPIVLYVVWLALKHRSLLLFTAVNPAIPGGGFVGESKSQILEGLAGSPEFVAAWRLIPARRTVAARIAEATAFQAMLATPWPLVLKPDVGERGSGVAIVRSAEEIERYLARAQGDVIVQAYAPGQEFGVFYLREPGQPQGRIFSVTEKRFPTVTGDGEQSLEDLILADDRAVCMARFYLRLHAGRLADIPPAGETVPLVELGTHCRGAAFFDGGWVTTPALSEAIDRISARFTGFHFGRYDIRTPSVEEFQQGWNFKIVELNGATAEATSIYDPENRIGSAYRTLREQWRLLFEIAAANVAAGARPATASELWRLVRDHGAAIRSHP